MADHEHIDALKAAADPQRVAVALGLQGRGRRFFCPVCQSQGGKTPDLAIGDKGFTCHKCGEKGDILKLIEVAAGLDFPSAVRWLEDLTGIASPVRHRKSTGKTTGRTGIVKPGTSCEAFRPDPVKTTGPAADPAIYEAFLTACRPIEGRALDFLIRDKGVKEEVVLSLGLRFCGREYKEIMDTLTERFGKNALKVAGLLKESKTKAGSLVPSFWHYYAKKAGFLVIPYMLNGRPVYLKARPPVLKEDAERLGLVRFLNTAAAVPCLYNVDILNAQPGRVLICEGESDTWTALSYGFAAVGSPGSKNFKAAWVESFRGREKDGRSTVFLVLDADKAGGEGSLVIAGIFKAAGLPVPLKLVLPPGMDLTDFMKDGLYDGRH
jgi:hypothetical protein